jgi:hypothetical protein
MKAVSAATYNLFADYELGAVRKIPMTVRLNIDVSSGV